jgi:hypothetical protein
MRRRFCAARASITVGACLVLLSAAVSIRVNGQTLFKSGQDVQPVFEGWERNEDGTLSMVFGYLNRNYVETPDIPVGPSNSFSPGPPDRGQPTYFYPRRQSFVFRVMLPADWGQKELTWTVTHNGKSEKAVASLAAVWEIDEGVWKGNRQFNTGGGMSGRASLKNYKSDKAPVIQAVGPTTLTTTILQPLVIKVLVSDDGVPGPGPERQRTVAVDGVAVERPSAAGPPPGVGGGGPIIGTMRLGPNSQDMVKEADAYATGLAVTFLQYRGAGKVTFDHRVVPLPKNGGEATTTVRFSAPGTYVIRAVGDDRIYTTSLNFAVTVR